MYAPFSAVSPRHRMTSLLVLGLGAMALLLAESPTPSGAVAAAPDGKVVATDSRAHALPVDPLLKAGEIVIITVRGFEANAPLVAKLMPGAQVVPPPRANADGTLKLVYRVPRGISAGRHVLAITGAPAPSGSGVSSSTGNVTATIPNLGLFEFHSAS
jgi:hypothetical protein